MKHRAGWFRRNNTIVAQAEDLARQLQEARDIIDALAQGNTAYGKEVASTRSQLHRVARERDNERKLRLETYVVCHDAMNQIAAERKKRIDAEEQLDDACSRYVRLAEYLQQKLSAEREKRLAAEKDWHFEVQTSKNFQQAAYNWEHCYREMKRMKDDAEGALLDHYLDKSEKDEEERAADKSWLADVDNEEE